MMAKKDDVSALAMGWLTIPAAGDSCSKNRLTATIKNAYPFRPIFNGSKVL